MAVLTGDNRFARVTGSEAEENTKGDIRCMCDVLDAIEKKGYDTGFDEGEASKARKVAIRMHQKGVDVADIADYTGTGTETILEWLNAAGEL